MSEIRQLEQAELKQIFRTHMREDFPLMELRPWFSIERVWERGGYTAYGCYEDGSLLAYASFLACKEPPCVLFDYLAVIPERRGQGAGTAFLGKLLPEVSSGRRIFCEVESVPSAKDGEEGKTRQRRLDFYLKNGAEKTGVNCHLFGVDYNILCFPPEPAETAGKEAETAGKEGERPQDGYFDVICGMYRELYGPVYGRLCRPYREEEAGGPRPA